ncbi:MAG: TatD DNase family protein [Clostridiales bacterium]|nr:TatD DNase family protein [Clostridiales bacterium]
MILESHAHYEDEAFDEDRNELLNSFSEQGIGVVVNVSSSLETIERTLLLCKQYPFIYGAVGVHPEECAALNDENFEYVKRMLSEDKVVAVGEIGLDYYWDEPERSIQKKWFEAQIALAREAKLPMIIHSRDAAQDTLDILKAHKSEEIGGVIHCFSYGTEMAREYLNMGFYLGIGGVVTFNNAKKLKEVVAYAPIESIVLETDSPYLSPVPNRGKRNSSLNLVYVAKEIAKIKGLDYHEVVEITEQNAKRMYQIHE